MSSPVERTPPEAEIQRLLGNLHSSLDEETGLVATLRALPSWARGTLVAAVVCAMLGAVFVLARRVDFAVYPPLRLALSVASYVMLLALVAGCALRPLHQAMESAGREMALVAACFLAPFVWALSPPPVLSHFIDTTGGGKDCLAVGVLLGAVVVAVVRVLDRAPEPDFRSAALVAAAGGLTANLALVVHCPQTRPLHLALVHAPIGLLLLFVYRRLGRLVPRRAG